MGYMKTLETKIIRTKHKVTFREGFTGTSAGDLVEMLKQVPADAKVDEALDLENGEFSIEFHEEKTAD